MEDTANEFLTAILAMIDQVNTRIAAEHFDRGQMPDSGWKVTAMDTKGFVLMRRQDGVKCRVEVKVIP